MPAVPQRRLPKVILRSLLSAALAFVLIYYTLKASGGSLWQALDRADKGLLLLAFASHGTMIGLTVFRWNLLLRVQRIFVKPWELARLSTIGLFFNLTLPGAVSGDVVKMTFLARLARGRIPEAVLTILLDRVIGLAGLFVLASAAVAAFLPTIIDSGAGHRHIQISAITIGMGCLLGIIGMVVMEKRRRILGIGVVARPVEWLARKLPAAVTAVFQRVSAALDLYSDNRRTVLRALAVSVAVHGCFALTAFLISRSVGAQLGLLGFFLAVPIANAVGAIPVTPGGLGTRDATLAIYLSWMQAPDAVVGVVPVMLTLVIISWALIGGIVYVFYRAHETGLSPQSTTDEELEVSAKTFTH